ncbi:Hypothetical predicted protein [Mytilus galloprovincialis]|uniref:Uncharacterized protein n=1 Tax=Mytilus galloprovincialis TaxID=29158 RepID=A0A8B6F709_MYTGA|nr:Hypothetical predicted protein [Mytilus galloprovincialis]
MTGTATYPGSDDMTLPWDQDVITEKEQLDKSNEDSLSREIIGYYTLTLMIVVPGICLSLFFYTHKIVPKKRKTTFVIPPDLKILQNGQGFQVDESLYDNIDDTYMLGCIEQTETSTDHLDVLGGSNNRGSFENISFFGDSQNGRNQDPLNQPVIGISPTNINITQATVHNTESIVPGNKKDNSEHEHRLQEIDESEKDPLCLQCEYDIASVDGRLAVPKRYLSNITERISLSYNNLNIAYITLNSTGNNMPDFHYMRKAKSESNIV